MQNQLGSPVPGPVDPYAYTVITQEPSPEPPKRLIRRHKPLDTVDGITIPLLGQ
jgi:hypothetical protein